MTIYEKGTGYEESTTRLFPVAPAPVTLKVIPESRVFKPGLEMSYLVVAQEPDGSPVDTDVTLTLVYINKVFDAVYRETVRVATSNGKAIVKADSPRDAAAMLLEADAGQAYTSLILQSGHSPSGSFIHVEQVTGGRHPGRRYPAVPGQLDPGSPQLLLRSPVQGHRHLHRRNVGPGHRVRGDGANGPVVAHPRVPGPPEQ